MPKVDYVELNKAVSAIEEEFRIPNDQMTTVAGSVDIVANALTMLDSASSYLNTDADRKSQLMARILTECMNLSRQRPVGGNRPGGVVIQRPGARKCDECGRLVIVVD